MDLILQAKINEILKDFENATELSDTIIQLVNERQQETVDVAVKEIKELKLEMQLRLDIKDLRAELHKELHRLERDRIRDRADLEKSVVNLHKQMTERFAGLLRDRPRWPKVPVKKVDPEPDVTTTEPEVAVPPETPMELAACESEICTTCVQPPNDVDESAE